MTEDTLSDIIFDCVMSGYSVDKIAKEVKKELGMTLISEHIFGVWFASRIGGIMEVELDATVDDMRMAGYKPDDVLLSQYKSFVKNWTPKIQAMVNDFVKSFGYRMTCNKCGSARLTKDGHKLDKQTYICKDCHHKFYTTWKLSNMRYPNWVVLEVIRLSERYSTRQIEAILLEKYYVKIANSSIYYWIKKKKFLLERLAEFEEHG